MSRIRDAVELMRGWDDRLYLQGKKAWRWDGLFPRRVWVASGKVFPLSWVKPNGEYLGPVTYIPESSLVRMASDQYAVRP